MVTSLANIWRCGRVLCWRSYSTSAFEPVSLDWTRFENATLVEDDLENVESFGALQSLSQDYCKCSSLVFV